MFCIELWVGIVALVSRMMQPHINSGAELSELTQTPRDVLEVEMSYRNTQSRNAVSS
jgi:hypothetical protein